QRRLPGCVYSASTAKVWRNKSDHDQARRAGDGGSSTARAETCAGPGAGLDDASALGGSSIVTTGSSCGALLASSPPADHGALGGTGGAAGPHRTAESGPTGSSVSRPVGDRPGAPPTVRRQHAMVQDEVDARARRQGCEAFQQFDRFEQQVRGAVAP